MFWLRNKKNNLLLHTLLWGPALVVVMGLFLILYFPCWFLDRSGCKLNAEYQQIKNWDSQREIVIRDGVLILVLVLVLTRALFFST